MRWGEHTVSRLSAGAGADRRGHRGGRRGDGHAALERRDGLGRAGADRARPGAAAHRLRSADVAEIDRRMDAACAHNWFAKSAIEMACWDIHGKAEGKPVYELLGGAVPAAGRSAAASAWGPTSPTARPRAGQRTRGRRLHTIKVKVGRDAGGRRRARARACARRSGPTSR